MEEADGRCAGCSVAVRGWYRSAAQHLLRSATDLFGQDVDSVESIHAWLGIQVACDRGLQVLLTLIDVEEHIETRELAGECCEER